jgi:hypothetical protein
MTVKADKLRQLAHDWRQKRPDDDLLKFFLGNVIFMKAVAASSGFTFRDNLDIAGDSLKQMLTLLDPPFQQ